MTETVEKTENEKNLLTAFVAGFKNMFNFKTRASKYDYWGFVFANFLFSLVIFGWGMVISLLAMSLLLPIKTMMIVGTVLYYVYSLLETIAVLALSVRRLHDTNHSGQLLWLPLIFGVGIIFGTMLTPHMKYIGIGLMGASGVVVFGVMIWLLILYLRKGQAEENRYGKPVEESPKYNKQANIYIILYFIISIVLSAISVALDKDSDQQDATVQNTSAANTISNKTSDVTADADSNADIETQKPVKSEAVAQPETSAEVETPDVPMHESAE